MLALQPGPPVQCPEASTTGVSAWLDGGEHATAAAIATSAASATAPAAMAPTEQPNHPAASQSPENAGEQLALGWCRAGATTFQAFGTPGGLPSCDQIGVRTNSLKTEAGLTTAVIELSVQSSGYEERRYVYLASGEHVGVFELAHGFSSGVGGFSHHIELENTQLRNVYGDAAPEWSTEIVSEQHDADMGICAVDGSTDRSFVLCTPVDGDFACLGVPVSKLAYKERADTKQGICGPPRTTSVGFARNVTLEAGAVRLEPDPKATPFTRPTAPPFAGRSEIGRRRLRRSVLRSSEF